VGFVPGAGPWTSSKFNAAMRALMELGAVSAMVITIVVRDQVGRSSIALAVAVKGAGKQISQPIANVDRQLLVAGCSRDSEREVANKTSKQSWV
jgi:hypothetical protein